MEEAAGVVTAGYWFGAAERPALGWLTCPAAGAPTSAVVVAPPVGYPYWCSHRTLRVLAERLAGAGHAVLRFDYDGTGDSAGDQWDPDRVAAWRATLAQAVAEVRRRGARTVTVIGTRLGGLFALLDGGDLGIDRAVAWNPVSAGRRYAKELRLLSQAVPEAFDPLRPSGTRVVAGSVFSAQTLSDLQRLGADAILRPPAPATLVIDDQAGSAAAVVDRLRALGAAVEHVPMDGAEQALETPPEFATVPEEILDAACAWIGPAGSDVGPATEPVAAGGEPASAALTWRGGSVTEEVMTLRPAGHVAIVTSPPRVDPALTTLVLLNPGSEPHIGPGRAWVEYARDLALRGRRTVRVDFLGWGESPDAGRAPGRPYAAVGVEDTVAIIEELRSAGHQRIAICGLCASAWIALATAVKTDVDGVVAINPQMYWQQGDPVEIDWDLIRARRADEIRRIERGARLGLWTGLDLVGHRPRAGRWLDDLAATGASVHFLFAEGDDGLVYLNSRLSRRVRRLRRQGAVSVTEMAGVDHPMHLAWVRPQVVDALAGALSTVDAG
jgi:alpha-beta hydrolase superfamily lysophospholipase